ncbi:MAG: hypothetical protein AB8G11_07855 [Saprospiraceae bacterium]
MSSKNQFKPYVNGVALFPAPFTKVLTDDRLPNGRIVKINSNTIGLQAITASQIDTYYANFHTISLICFQSMEFDEAVKTQFELLQNIIECNIVREIVNENIFEELSNSKGWKR